MNTKNAKLFLNNQIIILNSFDIFKKYYQDEENLLRIHLYLKSTDIVHNKINFHAHNTEKCHILCENGSLLEFKYITQQTSPSYNTIDYQTYVEYSYFMHYPIRNYDHIINELILSHV